MKTLLILSLLFFSINGIAQNNYDVDLIPATLRNRANACIRNEETIVDMRSAEQVAITVDKAITVFNENGEDEARLVLYYDKNTSIKSAKGEVLNSVGMPVSKFTLNDFTDVSVADGFSLFIDSRVKHFLPNVSQYPYTIVYHYEIKNKQNLIIPKWIPKSADDISVEKSTYTFISKPTDEVRIKTINCSLLPEESSTDKQKKMIWKIANIPAAKTEPYSPKVETYLPSVQIAPKQFTYYGYSGTYQNWKESGKWVFDDLIKPRNMLSPATISLIQNLVKDQQNDWDKARKIYEYLQHKTRYISVQVGIGGFQPIAASEVDRLGYGDCKGLVNYMQSMLHAVNIDSYYCVVQAGDTKTSIDPNFADMTQGNHIILCMPLKGDTTWLECTNQKIPFGYLGDFTDDRLVFACTPEGGKILRTPKLSAQHNLQYRKANFTVSENGTITGNVNTIFTGAQYDNHESTIGKSIIAQRKTLQSFYNIDNINFDNINYSQDKGLNPQTIENLEISIPNYAAINGNKMFLQPNMLNVSRSIPELKVRSLPVYINRAYTDVDEVVYQLPGNVSESLIIPDHKHFKSEFGNYDASVKFEGRKVIYRREIKINDGTYPAEKYQEFSQFMNEIQAADQLKLMLNLK